MLPSTTGAATCSPVPTSLLPASFAQSSAPVFASSACSLPSSATTKSVGPMRAMPVEIEPLPTAFDHSTVPALSTAHALLPLSRPNIVPSAASNGDELTASPATFHTTLPSATAWENQ